MVKDRSHRQKRYVAANDATVSSAIPTGVLDRLNETESYSEPEEATIANAGRRRRAINPLGRTIKTKVKRRVRRQAYGMYLPWFVLLIVGALAVLVATVVLLVMPVMESEVSEEMDGLNALISGGAPGVYYDVDDDMFENDALLQIIRDTE